MVSLRLRSIHCRATFAFYWSISNAQTLNTKHSQRENKPHNPLICPGNDCLNLRQGAARLRSDQCLTHPPSFTRCAPRETVFTSRRETTVTLGAGSSDSDANLLEHQFGEESEIPEPVYRPPSPARAAEIGVHNVAARPMRGGDATRPMPPPRCVVEHLNEGGRAHRDERPGVEGRGRGLQNLWTRDSHEEPMMDDYFRRQATVQLD